MPRRESRSRKDRDRRGSSRRDRDRADRHRDRTDRHRGSSRRDRDDHRHGSLGHGGRESGQGAIGENAVSGQGGLAAANEGLLQQGAQAAVPPGQHRLDVDFTPLRTKLVVWNAFLLVFGITLLTEGLYLMYQAYNIAGAFGTDSAAGDTAAADTEGGLGASVVMAGLLVFILAATQYTQCCHAECCAQMSYIIWSMFLVIYELGVSFAVIAVANWDKVQQNMGESDMSENLSKIAVPAYSPGAKANLYVVVGVLVASGLMQIGAVVLHVKRRTELANWFIMDMDDQTGGDDQSYGSGSGKNNNNRLAELRDYYAQLYAEHGLSVPSELRNPHPV